ncbi:hypothetical protein ACSFA8_26465 [Variovorax sp. RT4R15]|uniref:hypothetical protein n=1 Tax=Variovorax sp. RT4R15 TaxID=3443737 RepID=UPI003F45F010
MIESLHRLSLRRLLFALAVPCALLLGASAGAAPGAHGPNGEHLDGPAQASAATGSSAPRMEAKSETFELVGTLRADEFSMLINRFETNEPVLNAKVEVESGTAKAPAKFHADLGDYAVDDAAFLKVLQAPGEHGVVITVVAGADADLLDGTLKSDGVVADAHGHSHDAAHARGIPISVWLALALLALGALIYLLTRSKAPQTGAAQ